MEFESDPSKSRLTEIKHHIDFEAAEDLWEDEDRIVIPARSETEERQAILAKRNGQIWAAFFTLAWRVDPDHLGKTSPRQRKATI